MAKNNRQLQADRRRNASLEQRILYESSARRDDYSRVVVRQIVLLNPECFEARDPEHWSHYVDY